MPEPNEPLPSPKQEAQVPGPAENLELELQSPTPPGPEMALTVTIDIPEGGFRFEWTVPANSTPVAQGFLTPYDSQFALLHLLAWQFEKNGTNSRDGCNGNASSVRALLNRIRKKCPFAPGSLRIGIKSDIVIGPVQPGAWFPLIGLADPWKWLGGTVYDFALMLERGFSSGFNPKKSGQECLRVLTQIGFRVRDGGSSVDESDLSASQLLDCRVTFDQIKCTAEFVWTRSRIETPVAVGQIHGHGAEQLSWKLDAAGQKETAISTFRRNSIRKILEDWFDRFRTNPNAISVVWIKSKPGTGQPLHEQEPPFAKGFAILNWLEENVMAMGESLRFRHSPLAQMLNEVPGGEDTDFERYLRRLQRKEQKRQEEEQQRAEKMARMAEERLRRQKEAAEMRRAVEARRTAELKAAQKSAAQILKPTIERAPLPPVPIHFESPPLAFQETALPLSDLRGFLLQERAALWWVSNQSDDLLCLEYCRIERLEYQLRTARRVLGPLRGRALLSDEVGLGKTIEAGLVIKELLTRGMVKRFLILTVPSLVDQWAEELEEKFGLNVATTNQPGSRTDVQKFWTEPGGIVASLHTLKQTAHLEIARQVHWDILIVDEAHYLRNRDSKAWQAVNSLSRQFLLLLTATPVQNSLEDLYNLVTLLQPGQLPSPKEFRARFLDPKRPRQPREPEELRRLLGQVMIRNTRANAGIQLPPRRAETVLFEPEEAERGFWQQWEAEFRTSLSRLNPGLASLWGRLVLQAAGSSPAAWRAMLNKFPDEAAVRSWREAAPLESSWNRKCALIPPLTRVEGGAVIFTQFLETQAALGDFLQGAGVRTYSINGSTPAAGRQPITEEFRKTGGALLLTHSGTEGRNLQFCHRLANFDLPWNPMEIEQRIGRLHRLGQQQPVRIYNFVQAGSLQEHLLQILQEKLNLFELVVGETGMVLGERFGSDEFADEILKRWRESEGRVQEAFAGLGEELAASKAEYDEVKHLDETLFAKDYESI